MENVSMAKELDWPGLVDRIEISESAGIQLSKSMTRSRSPSRALSASIFR